jgi:hypothetical protein
MFRSAMIATILGTCLFAGSANAATYCAKYVGGAERVDSGARSQCNFATLKECRASVRARGGGKCYKQGRLRGEKPAQ